MLSKLPPINFDEDIEKYGANHSSQEIKKQSCQHSQIKYDKDKGELRCPCGVAFRGPQLSELYKLLTLDKP